ncbi:16234_t:CDS:2 [Funneliformis caledonium]|uniref:16234_t:CDS:1 n=1 Tax=Funneliformis caledonium TaxID=1117310 RepID=A0A9N8ZRZ8_9GLOM|nr:16234_t:CDS:2 [Funneliformis caledonium]
MEKDQNDTIIAPFQRSNKSSLRMTLPVAMNGPPSGTTTSIPKPPSNILSYVQLRQLYLGDRRQYDEENNDTYKMSFFDNANELERGETLKNVQQLVVSILSSNQSSRPSNLRVMTLSLGSNSSSRGNNTMEYQNVTTKKTSQPTTLILTSQLIIVPVGGNNDNAYLQVIQGLAGWLQGQQTRKQQLVDLPIFRRRNQDPVE